MQHPVRVEEEKEGGTGPRGRGRGGERPPGVAVWVAEGIIRVVLEKFIVFSALCFCFSCCLLLL